MPIGRDAEAARISTFLRDVPGGPRVLLIEGKAGIGKTTLLRKGHDTAVQLEITVLSRLFGRVRGAAEVRGAAG
jgi:predicted ATPase